MNLKIGITAQPFTPPGIELVRQAERLGVDSVWTPEFWAADALTPLAYLAGQTSTIRLGTATVRLGAARRPCWRCQPRACRRCRTAGSSLASARRRVPTAIGLGTNLIGTDDHVRDRLRQYRDAGITTLRAQLQGDPATDLDRQLTDLARLLALVREIDDEARLDGGVGSNMEPDQ